MISTDLNWYQGDKSIKHLARIFVSITNQGKLDLPVLQNHHGILFLIGVLFSVRTLEAKLRKLWLCFVYHVKFPQKLPEPRVSARLGQC